MEDESKTPFLTVKEEKAQRLKEARARNRGKPAPCPVCGMILSNTYNLNCHIRRHRNDKPFKCDQCPLSFILMQELKRHKVTHATERPYKCKICTKGFKSIEMLRIHMDSHGANEYKCHYCDEKFKRYKSRATHEMRCHVKSDLKCKYCYKSFVEKKFKDLHEQTTHKKLIELSLSEGNENIKMESSSVYKAPNIVGLENLDKRRIRSGKKIKKDVDGELLYYPCKFCPERFKYRREQVTHYQEKHKEDYDKVFSQCKICLKLLTNAHFKTHMMAHEGIFKHKCALCDYKSSRLTDLKCHMLVHVKDNKYHCSFCNKPFRTQKYAMFCEKRHHGSKDKKCNLCDRTFFSNVDLKSHMIYLHKHRKCPYCEFETNSRCIYERHKTEHKKKLPLKQKENKTKFMCEVCGRFFSSQSYMMTHMKVHDEEFKEASQNKGYYCYYCAYKGTSSSDILNHSISKHPEKVKFCKFCTYSSLNTTLFRNHLKHHVNGSSEDFYLHTSLARKEDLESKFKIVECFICGYISSSFDEFTTHVDFHNETLSDFEWYYMDFFYCALKDRPSEIRVKNVKEVISNFPSDELTFVDIKDSSAPIILSELDSKDDEVECLGYSNQGSYKNSVNKHNNYNEDCEIVPNIETLVHVKEYREDSVMNSNSFIEIDAEMNYCTENLTDNPPSTKKTIPIIKDNLNEETNDKVIEISEENLQNVTIQTEKYKNQVKTLPQKIESQGSKEKKAKFIFNLDVLKNKLQNINGKLFLSLEDLCSVGTIKKEPIDK